MIFDEWAKSIFKHGSDAQYGIAKAAWDEATKIEREACAKVCDALDISPDHLHPCDCAEAIRSMGT